MAMAIAKPAAIQSKTCVFSITVPNACWVERELKGSEYHTNDYHKEQTLLALAEKICPLLMSLV